MSCPTGNCGDGKLSDLLDRMQNKKLKKKTKKPNIFPITLLGYVAYFIYYVSNLVEDQFIRINLYIIIGILVFGIIQSLIKNETGKK